MSADPPPALAVAGIGLWSPALPGWPAGRAVLRGNPPAPEPARLPPSTLLPAAERRRAPATVTLALAVAAQACESAGLSPHALPAVFTSSGGDLEITDYLCEVLARAPEHLSPTRFHHSVHNAPAGYWTIATGCQESSSALAAGPDSFAAGLLEAATLCACEGRPVLFVAYDMPARGPLAEVTHSEQLFGAALVLAPMPADWRGARLGWRLREPAFPGEGAEALGCSPWVRAQAAATPAARGLPLLEALAGEGPSRCVLRVGAGCVLALDVSASPDAPQATPPGAG